MVSIRKNYTLYFDRGGPFVVPIDGPLSLIVPLYFRQSVRFIWFGYGLVDCVKYILFSSLEVCIGFMCITRKSWRGNSSNCSIL